MDDQAPIRDEDARTLRFLRLLVTALAGTMIAGLIVLIVLFVTRFPADEMPILPSSITLPDGVTAEAVTIGPTWYAVVSAKQEILIFDRATGALRQRVTIGN